MPQHLLDRMDICAVFQQVCCEGVTEGVGSNILFNPRFPLIMLYDLPESLSRHVFPTDIDKEGLLVCGRTKVI